MTLYFFFDFVFCCHIDWPTLIPPMPGTMAFHHAATSRCTIMTLCPSLLVGYWVGFRFLPLSIHLCLVPWCLVMPPLLVVPSLVDCHATSHRSATSHLAIAPMPGAMAFHQATILLHHHANMPLFSPFASLRLSAGTSASRCSIC